PRPGSRRTLRARPGFRRRDWPRRGLTPQNRSRSALRGQTRPGSDPYPGAILLDDLAVQLDATAATEVLDQVPVQRADVRPADLRVAGADREVDRARHLLVEEDVPHRPCDPRVAADPELADDACALVEVEGG